MAVLENEKQLGKIVAHKEAMPGLALALLFDPASPKAKAEAEAAGLRVISFDEACALGEARSAARSAARAAARAEARNTGEGAVGAATGAGARGPRLNWLLSPTSAVWIMNRPWR